MHPEAIIKFSFFGKEVGIYLYGLMIAVGLIACLTVFFIYTTKSKMNADVQDFTYFVAIGAVAVGFLSAKLFQAFYDYIATGKWSFANAGLTVMGGLIGGIVSFIVIYFGIGHFVFKKKKEHIPAFNEILRVAPCCITVTHAFGRLGCMFAGCCYGRVSNSGFGMYMKGAIRVPTQLYESIFLFSLFVVLTILYFKKFNVLHTVYLVAYGIWRIIIEYFRADYRGGVEGSFFTPSQWQSCLFIVFGLALLGFYILKKYPIFLKTSNDQNEKLVEIE